MNTDTKLICVHPCSSVVFFCPLSQVWLECFDYLSRDWNRPERRSRNAGEHHVTFRNLEVKGYLATDEHR
jgi:hypothetical protein